MSTFAINYRGHPFMESLTENRSLLYSLAGAGGFVVMLALGWLPEFSDQFSIVDFSDEFRSILLQVFLHNIYCTLQVHTAQAHHAIACTTHYASDCNDRHMTHAFTAQVL